MEVLLMSSLLASPVSGMLVVRVEGNVERPAGWACSSADKGIIEVREGKYLYVGDKGGHEVQARCQYPWQADLDKPATIEARVKVERCDAEAACAIAFGDGVYGDFLTLFPERIELANAKKSYAMNTTAAFHTYRLELKNGEIAVSVDQQPVFSAALAEAPCRDEIGFGSFTTAGKGAAWWDHFEFAVQQKGPLSGGTVVVDDLRVVRLDPAPMNFMFMQRFADGTLWLGHSIGQHMVDERAASIWSRDSGKTWTKPDLDFSGMGLCQLADGSILGLRCWHAAGKAKEIEMTTARWPSPTTPPDGSQQVKVALPWASTLWMHRSFLRLHDGRLLVSAYGERSANPTRSFCFGLESRDSGKTWQFLAVVAEDGATPVGNEGYGEPCFVELQDGSLLCMMRTGNPGPLMQCKSADGGKTWSQPVQVDRLGVDPHVILLGDGTLLAASGRPGVYLLVDFTGTGDHWQKIWIYRGPGSSYTSLAEIAPGNVILIYDESAFCLDKGPGIRNRIMCLSLTIGKAGKE
jgi:hypothetical protein